MANADGQFRTNRKADRQEARTAALLSTRTVWSRLALAIDRLVQAAWPAFATLSFFYAATAFGLWRAIDDVWRLAALVVFCLAAAFSLWRLLAGFAWPAWRDGRSRLDRDRADRPVATFDERLALGAEDDGASALWGAHRVGVTERARQVRAAAPDLVIGRKRDPLYLRYIAAAALAAALAFGPGAPPFADAVRPVSLTNAPPPPDPSLEVWATPPAYTGAPPLYFADRAARTGDRVAPEDTVLSVRLFDVDGTPQFVVTPDGAAVGVVEASPLETESAAGGESADAPPPPAELRPGDADGVYLADIRLLSDAQVALVLPGQTEPALDLSFAVTPDRAPEVLMADPPARSGDGELSFSFRSADDYGVARAWAQVTLDPDATIDLGDGAQPAEPRDAYEFELPTPLARFGNAEDAVELTPTESAALDDEARAAAEEEARLTALYGPPNFAGESFAGHPWIGLPVTMRLHVEDAKGQRAETDAVRFELPGRLFSEPMAKALIEQRGSLSWNVALAARAHRILSSLIREPDDYFSRPGDYLFTRMAIARLAVSLTDDRVAEARDDVMAALYAAAERLEDAGLDSAAERLARAERRLREALESGASDEELAALMRELREAIQQYLQALRQLAERNPELAEQMLRELGENSPTLGSDQLQEMLRALEEAARGGRREEAEQMLSMLEQLLDSLRPGGGQQQAGQGQPGQGQQGQGQQALEELEEMIQEQQRQAEDSFEAERQRRDQQFGQGQPNQGQQSQPGQGQPGQGQPGQGQPGQGQSGQGQSPSDQFGQQQPGQQGRRGGRDGQLEDQPGFGANPDGLANEQGRGLDSESLRQRQEALRQLLEDLERRMDDLLAEGGQGGDLSEEDRQFLEESRRNAQDALEEAEEAMRSAEDALSRDAPGEATDEQIDAVESLRDAYRSSREAAERADRLARGDQQQNGQANGADQGPGQEGRDPLGRPRGDDPLRRADSDRRNESADGSLDDSGLRPGGLRATPREEARRILEDIRRRLSDRERTIEELDYLRRLLERF